MDTIKLRSKKTGQVYDCDIHLSNYPQLIEVTIVGGEGHSYDDLADLATDWKIVKNNK